MPATKHGNPLHLCCSMSQVLSPEIPDLSTRREKILGAFTAVISATHSKAQYQEQVIAAAGLEKQKQAGQSKIATSSAAPQPLTFGACAAECTARSTSPPHCQSPAVNHPLPAPCAAELKLNSTNYIAPCHPKTISREWLEPTPTKVCRKLHPHSVPRSTTHYRTPQPLFSVSQLHG